MFAAAMADPKSNIKLSSQTSSTTRATLSTYLSNPVSNATMLSNIMYSVYHRDGVISRVINYFLSHLTYNHNIYPVIGSDKNAELEFPDSTLDDFIATSTVLDNLNLRYYAPAFIEQTFISGVSYWYEVSDTKGIAYMQFPYSWGRIVRQDQGVYRWRLDISKLKTDIYDIMPKEIQTAYDTYRNGGVSSDDPNWYDGRWYILSDKAVAFCFDQTVLNNGGVAVSPFASVLMDESDLDTAKGNVLIKDKIDTIRLVHSKIPTDKEGTPLMSIKTARAYDTQLKNSLPSGVVAVTSATDLQNIPLSGSGNSKSYEMVEKANNLLFTGFGVAQPLFGGSTTSANIVKLSIQKDANWLYTIVLPALTNYYNYKLNNGVKRQNKKMRWNIRFLNQSYYTAQDDMKNLKDALTYGGSRTDILAAAGMSPIEIYSKLKFEQEQLKIDDLMIVKPTANNIGAGGDPTSNGAGRPVTDNPSDDTDRIEGNA